MGIIEAIILGAVEGITEFLPVSSTGHLTVAEKLFGHSINSHDITAFTAIIQIGAVLATLLYFRKDIWRIVSGWLGGLVSASGRRSPDYKFGWAIIAGSVPIAVAGLAFKDQVEGPLRNLWIVAFALLAWSFVMWLADRTAAQVRHEKEVTAKDTIIIGLVQCLALIPGVSRSGATMSAGLFRGFDRGEATRLSFFLAIPALVAAAIFESASQFANISNGVGWTPTIVATIASFVVAYAAIAWLLRYISKHSFMLFIAYRLAAGVILLALLATGAIAST